MTATEVGGTVTMKNDGVEPVSFRYTEWDRAGSGFINEQLRLFDVSGESVTAWHYWYGGPGGGDDQTPHSVMVEPGQSESFRIAFQLINCGDTSYDEEPAVPHGTYRAVAIVGWSTGAASSPQEGVWVSEPVPVTVT
jgi:hypothetical protein